MLRFIALIETPLKPLTPKLKTTLAEDLGRRHCALRYASINGEELPLEDAMGVLFDGTQEGSQT